MELMNRLPSLSGRKKSEIVDMLLREEYGYFPSLPIDVSVSANIENKNFCAGKAVLEKLCFKCESAIGEYSFETFFAYPKNKDKSPCFIHINFAAEVPHRLQPTEELIDNGYAVMTVCHKNISSDDGDFKNGIAGIIYRDGERGELDCGKIGIWAWGAMRLMDYALSRDEVDPKRISVVGHSRLGKTALLAGALDERFYCAFSNDSGCSGASIARDNDGESVADICRVFPFWFCKNYYKYANNEDAMPFDQHFLIAANLPHRVYVASAEEDAWACPRNEYLAAVAASGYYVENGRSGLIGIMEGVPSVLHGGDIGYHIRRGTHYLSRDDWHRYIEYLAKKEREDEQFS